MDQYAQSPHMHLDQFGYTPNAQKTMVLSDPIFGNNSSLSYTPTDSIELREYNTNILIEKYAPQTWQSGAVDTFFSGDKGWTIDFSNLQSQGDYYFTDPVSLDTSAVIDISYTTYDEALKAASRMFYYNRCNMSKSAPFAEANWIDSNNNFNNALQDYNCRYIYDSNNPSLEKDLSGGWFDAGDYNKYVTFTMSTLHNLLWAYRINPDAFGDANNIPESGNGIPDIIDEIKWELDWLLKMSNSDGTVHIKMGSQNYSENISYPPSNNFDQRFYGPTCTSASLTVASVLAHASFVFADFSSLSSYATMLKDQAELSWDYILPFYEANNLEYNCDDGSIVAGDADFTADDYQEGMIAAAIYLFEATGKTTYNDFIFNNYLNSLVFGSIANDPNNASTYYDDWWDINQVQSKDAYLNYKNISGHNTQVADDFFDSFQAMINNNWENFYGTTNDLYPGYLPSYFLGWGSNSSQGAMGNMNFNVVTYGADNGMPDDYINKASEHLHVIHGCNPMGKLYLSNMYSKGGDKCADEIYHTWFADGSIYDNALTSQNGPAPGFLSGGPNHTYSGPSSPPNGEPMLKAYDDINDTNSISWEITEPAIYYQAAYIRLLASILTTDQATASTNIEVSNVNIEVYPNPTNQFFTIKGLLSNYHIDIINASGQIVLSIDSANGIETIDITTLGSGLYLLRMEHKTNNALFVQKIIKE